MLTICILAGIVATVHGNRAAVAAATELYVSLHYETDLSVRPCWDQGKFRRSVAGRVGYDPFREDAPLNITIRVGRSARALSGHVEWRNADGATMGERTFVAEDGNCVRLLAEMSFTVGLQIQLMRTETPAGAPGAPHVGVSGSSPVSSNPAPSGQAQPLAHAGTSSIPAPQASASTVPSALRPAATEPEPAIRFGKTSSSDEATTSLTPARWSALLGAGPALALGIAPSVTGTMRVFVAVRRNDYSVEIGAHGSYPSTERQRDGTSFREHLIGVSTAVCAHRDALSACVLGNASQVRVSGFGVDQPRTPLGYAAQTGLRVAASLEVVEPWFVTAHLDALGLLTPCTVDLNRVAVWEMPRFGALAGIDMAVRFR